MPLNNILLLLAFICFVIAAFATTRYVNMIGLGLALWVVTFLI